MTHGCCLRGWRPPPALLTALLPSVPPRGVRKSSSPALYVLTTALHLLLLCRSLRSSSPGSRSVGHVSEEAFVGLSCACQHSCRQHLGDLFPSVPRLFLLTAVIRWKHVQKGWTYDKTPLLFAEGDTASLRYPCPLLSQTATPTPALPWLLLPPVSPDPAGWYLHLPFAVLPVPCTRSRWLEPSAPHKTCHL